MQLLQININGTDPGQLMQEYMDALAAVSNAIVYLEKVTVHGRDYQTIANPNAATQAFGEHQERLGKLRQMERELATIAQDISIQMQERRRG